MLEKSIYCIWARALLLLQQKEQSNFPAFLPKSFPFYPNWMFLMKNILSNIFDVSLSVLQFLNQSPKFLLSKARKTLNGYKSFCGRFYLFAALLEWKSPTIQNRIFYVENQIQLICQVTNGCNGRKSPAAIPGNKTFAKCMELLW